MKNILLISIFSVIFSCSSKKNITEFIQLSHDNIMLIGGDKLTITLIPTTKKSKRSVTVKIFKNGENRVLRY